MSSQPLLLIQVGTPPDDVRASEGDLPAWFGRALGSDGDALQAVRVFEGEALPAPGEHRAAIITGSWAMVTDRLDWSEAAADWIRRAMRIDMPLFGVCYGHQLMAHALGGQVGYHPDGIEVGCQEIECLPDAASDPLAATLPVRFMAHLTHMQTVLVPPPGARVLARSAHDAHQIVRYGPRALSTQFHPEFTPAILAACVRRRADALRAEGRDPDAILGGLRETPVARDLLRQFVRACVGEALNP
ncbi:glutamine amidotransferase [Castellaniella denitrificans]|uniref:glutamine amidotransferase n=1 Tax=Castellaniella denitrificans TaxID=56119 RepID=UPI0036074217